MSRVVYVVDDEWVISTSLAAILNRSGFEATSFLCPVEALEAARDEPPDILVSDVSMPRMSGVDLAIQITASHPDCRVVLFSGQATTAHLLEDARERGYAFTLLAKPVHPTALLAALRVPDCKEAMS